MVIAAEMQQAVENELFDLGLEREAVLSGLFRGLLGGDDDVAEEVQSYAFRREAVVGVAIGITRKRVTLNEVVGFVGERENVGGRVLAAEGVVELTHSVVGDECDRERAVTTFFDTIRKLSHERTNWIEVKLDLAL